MEKLTFDSEYKDWKRVRILGEGAFGKVWLFQDRKDPNKKVAIKEFDRSKRDSFGECQIELKMYNKIGTHSHIVKYFDAYKTAGFYCIVLEFCEIGTLEILYKVKKYDERTIRTVILQCAGALEFMRHNTAVHRDIKPENILVRKLKPEINVALTDFNFGRTTDAAFHTTVMTTDVGTPSYSAPEVDMMFRTVIKKYNFKADVFSLGMVACQFLAARPKFKVPDELFGEVDAILAYYEELCSNGVPLEHEQWDYISNEAKEVVLNMVTPFFKRRCDYRFILKSAWAKKEFPKKLRPLKPEILIEENEEGNEI